MIGTGRFWLPILMTLAVLAWFRPGFAAVEIVPVHHRLPAELARTLSPLLEPGETVVPVAGGVAFKAGRERIAALRALVRRLDRPLKQIVLTVVQSDRLTLEDLNGRTYRGPVRSPGRRYASASVRDRSVRQRLRLLEGRAAYIVVGRERPVPVVRLYDFPPGAVGGIEYRPVTTGFKVTARLAGCDVRLNVSPWSGRLDAAGDDGREMEALTTTITASPGQWIVLGSHAGVETGSERPPRSVYRYRTRHGRWRVFLRVEIVGGC